MANNRSLLGFLSLQRPFLQAQQRAWASGRSFFAAKQIRGEHCSQATKQLPPITITTMWFSMHINDSKKVHKNMPSATFMIVFCIIVFFCHFTQQTLFLEEVCVRWSYKAAALATRSNQIILLLGPRHKIISSASGQGGKSGNEKYHHKNHLLYFFPQCILHVYASL